MPANHEQPDARARRRSAMQLPRLLPLLVVAALLLAPARGSAHPADEAAVYHYLWLQAGERRLELQFALLPGGRIAPEIWKKIDVDASGELSDKEEKSHARRLIQDLKLTIDGRPVPWKLVEWEYPAADQLTDSNGLAALRLKLHVPLKTAPGEKVRVGLADETGREWTGMFPPPSLQLSGYEERERVLSGDGRSLEIELFRLPPRLEREGMLPGLKLGGDDDASPSSAGHNHEHRHGEKVHSHPHDPGEPHHHEQEAAAGGTSAALDALDRMSLSDRELFPEPGVIVAPALHDAAEEHDHGMGGLGGLLEQKPGPGLILFGLGAALVLGMLHALTPGHGRGLVAAALVGSRGTILDAVLLGISTTVTHMGVTFLLAFATLWLTSNLQVDVVNRWLSIFSGLLVLGMGFWMLQNGLLVLHGVRPLTHSHCMRGHTHTDPDALAEQDVLPAHTHAGIACTGHHQEAPVRPVHQHEHAHQHAGAHPASSAAIPSERLPVADDPLEEHREPAAGPASGASSAPWETVVLGVASGVIPCIDAMALLVAAVNLRQLSTGLALIGAFSLGMALVLVGTGVAMVTARHRLRSVAEAPWARTVPALGGGLMLVFGAWLTLRSLIDAGILHLGG